MSSGPSSRPHWRPGDKASARDKSALGPKWRSEPEGPPRLRRRRWPWFRAFVFLVLFISLSAALVWMALWLRPAKNSSLVLFGANYEENLAVPANLYGWQALNDLAVFARDLAPGPLDFGQLQLQDMPRELHAAEDWQRSLRTFTGKTLFLVMSLHGGVDRDGGYFLTQNALLPRDPASREKDKIRLEELFDALAAVPRDRNIVLALDATQMRSDWSLGMLHNDFARALGRLEKRIADQPNLVVLSDSDVDQRSWVSEEWKQSVFLHFVLEGLKGAADRGRGLSADGRVDAAELYQYARGEVSAWAQTNRDAMQTPTLLPRGELGMQRAAAMHLAMTSSQYAPAPDAAPYTAPPELVQAWKRYADLEQQVPAPAVYTPHLWTLYQGRLLRYEELLRAGLTGPALTMANRLRDLDAEMAAAQPRDFPSAQSSLAMPAATGHIPTIADFVSRSFNTLWDSQTAQRVKTWTDLQKNLADKIPLVRLRSQFIDLCVQRAADDPQANIDKAYQLIELVKDPLQPRPAEAHLLAMLRRDAPRKAGGALARPDLVQAALKVRLRAERAALGSQSGGGVVDGLLPGAKYPYAEHVMPWLFGTLEPADNQRRLGQDLIFATDLPSSGQSAQYLQLADGAYAKIQDNALRLRQTMAVRDRIVPALPYYARYLARRYAEPDSRQSRDLEMAVGKFEDLAKIAHQLVDMLEDPIPPTAKQYSDEGFAKLSAHADRVLNQWNDLETTTRLFRESLDEVDLPGVWLDLDAAVSMPFADVTLRMELLARKSRIAIRLQHATANSPAQESGAKQTVATDRVKELARRRGRLSLSLLGRRWFGELAEHESYDQVRRRLENVAVDERWWESLLVAGDEIGLRFQRMSGAVADLLKQGSQISPQDAWVGLQKADRLIRFIDVRGALALVNNPTGLYRRALLEDLLYKQSLRTFRDHWQAEDPSQEPYYRVVGRGYLADARSFAEARFAGQDARVADLDKKLSAPTPITFALTLNGRAPRTADPSPTLHFTSEELFPLAYRMQTPPETDGIPVIWGEAGPGLALSTGQAANEHSPREIRENKDVSFSWSLVSPLLKDAQTTPLDRLDPRQSFFKVHGLYRGMKLETTTRIDLHPVPRMTVSEQPAPLKANVAVRASREVQQQFGAANGALAIVLDCSGSMGPAAGKPFAPTTKFVEATTALRGFLAKIPKGTSISVWVFGQSVGAEKAVKEAEKTVARVIAPMVWDPSDKTQLDGVMARVSYPAVEPWNESPIVRTMLLAKQDLKNALGFRSLLVITDGMDNRFDKDAEFNPQKKSIASVLRENFQDVVVNIVGFKVVSKEEEEARKQFQVIEQLPLPGKLYLVNQAAELGSALEKSLKQRLRYWIDTEDNRPFPTPGDAGLDVSWDGATDQWWPGGLTPGAYKVRVHTNRRLTQSVALNRGDLLLLELGQSRVPGAPEGALSFSRVLYSLADFPWKPAKEKGDWRLAALQNQRVHDNGLQMLLTLERKSAPVVSTVQQIQPAQVWMEAVPAGDYLGFLPERVHYQFGYPAPAWSLDAPRWPQSTVTQSPLKPKVRVWWSPDQSAPPAAVLQKGNDFIALADLANQAVRVNEEDVIVESVQVEDHLIQTRPAQGDQPARLEMKPCLVVRLKSSRDNPVWARVRGINNAGAEHRFYMDAGKYTGLFWPVTRDEAAALVRSLEIVSLPAFKRDAEARGFFMELDNLYEPQASDTRPLAPTEIGAAEP